MKVTRNMYPFSAVGFCNSSNVRFIVVMLLQEYVCRKASPISNTILIFVTGVDFPSTAHTRANSGLKHRVKDRKAI